MDEQNNQLQEQPVVAEVTVAEVPVVATPVVEPKRTFWSFFEKNFLAFSILLTGVLISGSLLYTQGFNTAQGTAQIKQDSLGNKVVDVSADDDPVLGSKSAKVTIIEFSDYQCPFCRVFWKDTFSQLKRDYIDTGKVRFVYRDYPLAFHPMAEPSAQAAECADEQGKYWEFHDKLFSEQDKKGQGTVQYTAQDLKLWASQTGLDISRFNQCLDSGKYKDEVKKDMDAGTAAGVTGTPSFFINGRFLVGAQPYATFKSVIDEELKKK